MKKLLAIGLLVAAWGLTASAQTLPYQNPPLGSAALHSKGLTAEQRADDLLKRLTLEEKVRLMMDTSPAIDHLKWETTASYNLGVDLGEL